jgi:hypothetical protein
MQFPPGTGQALCLFASGVHAVAYGPGHVPCCSSVSSLASGDVIDDALDYDTRFDCYYHQSDDGSRMYTTLAVLSLGTNAPAPRVLTQAEVDAHKMIPIQAVLLSVMAQRTEPEDLTFATHVFSSPVWLHAFWVRNHHDLQAACDDVLRSVFQL